MIIGHTGQSEGRQSSYRIISELFRRFLDLEQMCICISVYLVFRSMYAIYRELKNPMILEYPTAP